MESPDRWPLMTGDLGRSPCVATMYFSRLVSKMTSSRRTQNAACASDHERARNGPTAVTGQRTRQRAESSISAPIGRYTVIVVDLNLAAAVAPVELLIGGHRRCALQFRI